MSEEKSTEEIIGERIIKGEKKKRARIMYIVFAVLGVIFIIVGIFTIPPPRYGDFGFYHNVPYYEEGDLFLQTFLIVLGILIMVYNPILIEIIKAEWKGNEVCFALSIFLTFGVGWFLGIVVYSAIYILSTGFSESHNYGDVSGMGAAAVDFIIIIFVIFMLNKTMGVGSKYITLRNTIEGIMEKVRWLNSEIDATVTKAVKYEKSYSPFLNKNTIVMFNTLKNMKNELLNIENWLNTIDSKEDLERLSNVVKDFERRYFALEKDIKNAFSEIEYLANLEKQRLNLIRRIKKVKRKLSGSGIKIDLNENLLIDDLKNRATKIESNLEKYERIADKYANLLDEKRRLEGEIRKLRGKLKGSRVEVPELKFESERMDYLEKRIPEVRGEVERLKKIASNYEPLVREMDRLRGEIAELKERLSGSGIPLPELPASRDMNTLEKTLPELKKQVANLKRKATQYEKLLSEKESLEREIDDIKRRLEGPGVNVNLTFENTTMDYLRKRIPEIRKEVENLRKIAEKYEKLKGKWRELEGEARELIKAGAKIEIGKMPGRMDELEKEVKELEKKIAKYPKRVKIETRVEGEVVKDEWSRVVIKIKNKGGVRAEDVKIEYTGEAKIRGAKEVGSINPGEEKEIEVRILSKEAGYVPVEMKVSYRDAYRGETKAMNVNPEIYVKKEGRGRKVTGEKEVVVGAIGAKKIRDMYGMKGEKARYSWGEFGVYEIVRKIGSGGFSDVYLVERSGKRYAMKIPKGVDLRGDDTIVLSEKDLEQYGKEAEIWAMLTERVPDAVINLIDAGVHPFPWFVMELGDKSLKDAVNGLSYEEKIKLAMDLLGKLDKIHHFGVVHKDIKPENILYAGGEWKFTDFGLSKIVNKSSKSSQMLSGTLLYMAPEQISRKKFGGTDWRTDIWQMGVMIYELLTGHLPFEAEDAWEITGMILRDEPVPATEYGVSEEVWRVIEKALKKDKEERWQSAAEMKRELEGLL